MEVRKKIVVCDDDKNIAEVVKTILEMSSMDVEVECDSSLLCGRITAMNPQILIIDLWMPKISGDKIIRELRSSDQFKDLFIVCISASMDGRQIAMQAGADAFLPKPFDMDDIIRMVEDAVAA